MEVLELYRNLNTPMSWADGGLLVNSKLTKKIIVWLNENIGVNNWRLVHETKDSPHFDNGLTTVKAIILPSIDDVNYFRLIFREELEFEILKGIAIK